MESSARCERRLRALIDTDTPAEELERLARVDALLRETRCQRLRLVEPSPATAGTPRAQMHELRLTFGELALIYKALEAARTLDALPPEDELLDDTIELVDQALRQAMSSPERVA